MWETISDLIVHVQVAKASIFFRRYTLRKILPKIGTGLILLAPSVFSHNTGIILKTILFYHGYGRNKWS